VYSTDLQLTLGYIQVYSVMYRLTAHTRLHTGIQCTVQTYCTH
jgi:hypothetical protein